MFLTFTKMLSDLEIQLYISTLDYKSVQNRWQVTMAERNVNNSTNNLSDATNTFLWNISKLRVDLPSRCLGFAFSLSVSLGFGCLSIDLSLSLRFRSVSSLRSISGLRSLGGIS